MRAEKSEHPEDRFPMLCLNAYCNNPKPPKTGYRLLGPGCLWLLAVGFEFCSLGEQIGNAAPNREGSVQHQESGTVGTPWIGRFGKQETIGQIMARQRNADKKPRLPARPRRPRLGPDRTNLPQNRDSANGPLNNASERSFSAKDDRLGPQTFGVSFLGANLADANAFPPDSMGAVGPSQFLVGINGRIRTFDKTTGVRDLVLNTSMDVFFASVKSPAPGTFTSDPKLRYDRLSGRWIVMMIDVIGGNDAGHNHIMIAVSSGGILTSNTVWTFFAFLNDAPTPAGDNGLFADYPTLGIDANAVYIGANNFTNGNAFLGTTAFVVRKSSILGGGPIVVTAFRNLIGFPGGSGPFTPQGVDNFDPAATEGYFVGTDRASFGTLILRRVTDPGGTPSLSGNISVTVDATARPKTVPHLGNTGGTSGELDALDDRLFAAHLRNGRLWTAHNIGVDASGIASSTPSRDAVRWYELQNLSGTPSVRQSGTVFDSAALNPVYFWIPTIMVSGQGHVALGMSSAGNSNRISCASCGRLAGDPLNSLQSVANYAVSSKAYNPPGDAGGPRGRRWGDYSYTCVDPNDDMTMWTIQEYCESMNSWGVRVVRLLAPPPATPSNCSPASVVQGATAVTLAIAGDVSGGAGFFDPGPGFSNRLAAVVNGDGVTINRLTYSDLSNITMNVTIAPNATPGARTVTVTNPDGRPATSATGILTIVAVAPQWTITPASLDLGLVITGATSQAAFVISNEGPSTLTGSASVIGGPFSILSGTPFTLGPAFSTNLLISFSPPTPGAFSNAVVVSSNGGNATNALTGRAIAGPPTLLQPTLSGSAFSFSFATTAGITYSVQYKDAITDPVWLPLQSVSGDGTIHTITTSSSAASRFYRLAVQ